MLDNFFKINNETIKIIGISFPVIAIIGYLGGKLVEIFIQQRRDNRQEFRLAYNKFAESFTFFLQQLDTGESDLNPLILMEFPKHDLVMRDFIRYLGNHSRRKFISEWNKYEVKYYEVKNLGVFGLVAAIAPNIEVLNNVKSPIEMERWEFDRRKELHKIITSLFNITKNKGWL